MRRVWFALGLAAACGGAQVSSEMPPEQADVTEAPPPPDPLSYLPADASGVVRVNLAAVRRWPHLSFVRRSLASATSATPERERAFDELLDRGDELHFALAPRESGRPPELAALAIKGRFEPGAGQTLLRRIIAPNVAAQLNPVEVEGYPGLGDSDAALVEVGDGLYVVGAYRSIRPALATPAHPAALGSPTVQALLRSLPAGVAAVEGWLVGDEYARALLAMTPLGSEVGSTFEGVAFRLDLSSGADLAARARTSSAADATRLAGDLRRFADGLTQSFLARAAGLDVLGAGLAISTEGSDVVARLQVAEADLVPLLEFLERIVSARQASGQ